jgi:hypothetical protein
LNVLLDDGSTAAPDFGFTNDPPNGADRYGSEILPGEPPPDAEVCVFDAAVRCENRRARKEHGVGGSMGKNAAIAYPAKCVGFCPALENRQESPPRFPTDSPSLAAPVSDSAR